MYKLDRRKYPSGRRGSPAKGVAGLKPGEGSNPSFRATSEQSSLCSDVVFYLSFSSVESVLACHAVFSAANSLNLYYQLLRM